METKPLCFRLEEKYVRAVKEFARGLRERGEYPFTYSKYSFANDLRAFILAHAAPPEKNGKSR